jgi:hypothetical protein
MRPTATELAGTKNEALGQAKGGRGVIAPALGVAFEMARFMSS